MTAEKEKQVICKNPQDENITQNRIGIARDVLPELILDSFNQLNNEVIELFSGKDILD